MPTSSLDAYRATVRDRTFQDGCTVTDEVIGPVRATVGYRSNVKALSKVAPSRSGSGPAGSPPWSSRPWST
jgi:hypothetical protein